MLARAYPAIFPILRVPAETDRASLCICLVFVVILCFPASMVMYNMSMVMYKETLEQVMPNMFMFVDMKAESLVSHIRVHSFDFK